MSPLNQIIKSNNPKLPNEESFCSKKHPIKLTSPVNTAQHNEMFQHTHTVPSFLITIQISSTAVRVEAAVFLYILSLSRGGFGPNV